MGDQLPTQWDLRRLRVVVATVAPVMTLLATSSRQLPRKIPSPMALGRISQERFNRGSHHISQPCQRWTDS